MVFMKKLILILCLCIALTLCFVACDDRFDNSKEGQSQDALANSAPDGEEPTSEELTSEEPTSEELTIEDPTTNITQESIPGFENQELISVLVDYLRGLFIDQDALPTNIGFKISRIKAGHIPLLVKFDSKNYYYVCCYSDSTHEYEGELYCCADKYIWVKFNVQSDIQEYYCGQKIIAAFQINKAVYARNLLTNDRAFTMEHFQLYKTKFDNGKNINAPLDFYEEFVYLCHTKKNVVYCSKFAPYNDAATLKIVEVEDELYIAELIQVNYASGNSYYKDLKLHFEEYYDDLIGFMDPLMYSEELENGDTRYYGLFEVDKFIQEINK